MDKEYKFAEISSAQLEEVNKIQQKLCAGDRDVVLIAYEKKSCCK